eukprot:2849220-Pleurochrysis_carterae.AAC.1
MIELSKSGILFLWFLLANFGLRARALAFFGYALRPTTVRACMLLCLRLGELEHLAEALGLESGGALRRLHHAVATRALDEADAAVGLAVDAG